jgi:hypothetical protein
LRGVLAAFQDESETLADVEQRRLLTLDAAGEQAKP